MKLAAIYNTFDGEELLTGSLRQIYDFCEEVIIVYQYESNFGELYEDLSYTLVKVAEAFPKCRFRYYSPDHTVGGGRNEINKRTMGLNRARELGCTHFLLLDNDEYYESSQFEKALNRIDTAGYDATACRLYTYYKQPVYRLSPLENYYVPFVCKIQEEQHLGKGFPLRVDPTRGVRPVKHFYEFPQQDLMMHHYSYVRRNMRRKLANSSARSNFKDRNVLLEKINHWQFGQPPAPFTGYEVEEVNDLFGIGE